MMLTTYCKSTDGKIEPSPTDSARTFGIFGTGYPSGSGPGYLVHHTVSGFNKPVANIIRRITLTVALPTIKYEFNSTNETLLFVRFLIM